MQSGPARRLQLILAALLPMALVLAAAVPLARPLGQRQDAQRAVHTFAEATSALSDAVLALRAERWAQLYAVDRAAQPATARRATDQALARATSLAGIVGLPDNLPRSGSVGQAVSGLGRQVAALRTKLDAGGAPAAEQATALAGYSSLIGVLVELPGDLASMTSDRDVSRPLDGITQLGRAAEAAAQLQVIGHAAVEGGMTSDRRNQIAGLLTAQRLALNSYRTSGVPANAQRQAASDAAVTTFAELVAQVQGTVSGRPAVALDKFDNAGTDELNALRALSADLTTTASGRAQSAADATSRQLMIFWGLAAALALTLAVLVGAMAAGTGRRRRSADPDGEHPGLQFPGGEYPGNGYQGGEYQGAVAGAGRAPSGAGLAQILEPLARKQQDNLTRQSALVNRIQGDGVNADATRHLGELSRHLRQARRDADGLLLVIGRDTGRRSRESLQLNEVLRLAAAEVDHGERIEIEPGVDPAVVGHLVLPVVHLVAELMENAVRYSQPATRVMVRTRSVSDGVEVAVIDAGAGIAEGDRAELNALLEQASVASPEAVLGSGRAGIASVAVLSGQLGARVVLLPGQHGGTAAVVQLAPVTFAEGQLRDAVPGVQLFDLGDGSAPPSPAPRPDRPSAGTPPPPPAEDSSADAGRRAWQDLSALAASRPVAPSADASTAQRSEPPAGSHPGLPQQTAAPSAGHPQTVAAQPLPPQMPSPVPPSGPAPVPPNLQVPIGSAAGPASAPVDAPWSAGGSGAQVGQWADDAIGTFPSAPSASPSLTGSAPFTGVRDVLPARGRAGRLSRWLDRRRDRAVVPDLPAAPPLLPDDFVRAGQEQAVPGQHGHPGRQGHPGQQGQPDRRRPRSNVVPAPSPGRDDENLFAGDSISDWLAPEASAPDVSAEPGMWSWLNDATAAPSEVSFDAAAHEQPPSTPGHTATPGRIDLDALVQSGESAPEPSRRADLPPMPDLRNRPDAFEESEIFGGPDMFPAPSVPTSPPASVPDSVPDSMPGSRSVADDADFGWTSPAPMADWGSVEEDGRRNQMFTDFAEGVNRGRSGRPVDDPRDSEPEFGSYSAEPGDVFGQADPHDGLQQEGRFDSREFDSRQFDDRQFDSRQFDDRQFDDRQFDSRQFEQAAHQPTLEPTFEPTVESGSEPFEPGESGGFDRAEFEQSSFGPDAFDQTGFDQTGFDQTGFDQAGFDQAGVDQAGFDQDGFERELQQGGYRQAEFRDPDFQGGDQSPERYPAEPRPTDDRFDDGFEDRFDEPNPSDGDRRPGEDRW